MSQHLPTLGPTVSRRGFLGAAGALGSLLLLNACASAVQEASQAGTADATAVRGGTVTAGITTDVVPANFFTNSSAGITTIVGLAYESLISYPDDSLEVQPRLATAWELSADGRTLTLTLRDDVTFHSGRPFTSADVAFSLATYADQTWNGQMRSTAAAITAVDTSDPHTAVLTLATPLSNVYDLLDTVPIIDSESIDQLRTGEKYVGTGPFTVTSWVPGTSISFARTEDYWQTDRPWVDAVEVSVIPDGQALLAALKSGQVQLANGLSNRDIEALGDGFEPLVLDGAEYQLYVGANVTADGLQDVAVRQAIAYALDRDRIVDEVLRGVGYPINLPWPKYSPAYDEQANQTYALDVDKAKEIVAGLGQLPTFPLTYSASNGIATAAAAIVQANLAEVGITVELDPLDQATFVSQLIGQQFRGLWVTNHSWAQYTPSTLTVSAYPFNARKNASNYVSPEYVALADAAWQQVDGTSDEAVEAYGALSQHLLDSLFLVEIAAYQPQYAVATRLHDAGYTKRAELLLGDAFLS